MKNVYAGDFNVIHYPPMPSPTPSASIVARVPKPSGGTGDEAMIKDLLIQKQKMLETTTQLQKTNETLVPINFNTIYGAEAGWFAFYFIILSKMGNKLFSLVIYLLGASAAIPFIFLSNPEKAQWIALIKSKLGGIF